MNYWAGKVRGKEKSFARFSFPLTFPAQYNSYSGSIGLGREELRSLPSPNQ